MKSALRALALFSIFGLTGAHAEDGDDEDSNPAVVIPDDARVTGRAPPPLVGLSVEEGLPEPGTPEEMIGDYPARIVAGAQLLQMDVAFLNDCWLAMEGLYKRDYLDSKTRFAEIERRWGSGVGPVGEALVWQALMLENFDFRYDKQYMTTFRRAQQGLEQALLQPGNDTWETFLLGAILGVDAIHAMRKSEFITAINRGFEAMKYVARAAELAPGFVDAQLGDGLWLYWRSVIALNTPNIPSFSDERQKGIDMMLEAERNSIFLRPAATHALTYTWIEEGQMDRALRAAERVRAMYPNNVVNLLVLGRVQMYKRSYPEAEASYKQVLVVNDDNQRVHYYLQRLYLRWRKPDLSLEHADIYLAFPDITDSQRGYSLYYKGNLRYQANDFAAARELYEQAWRVAKIKSAKTKIERINQRGDGN
ncbi:MAG: tetratricopeptide (TPR) repeat protein [Myxococcota bacterium]|jgi:tetratricopeptide (TPR) repeat protein